MRFAAAVWRRAEEPAMIDLEKLATVANLPGEREVVSRSWLRQVLKELTAARIAQDRRNAAIDEIAKIFGVPAEFVSPRPIGPSVPSGPPTHNPVG